MSTPATVCGRVVGHGPSAEVGGGGARRPPGGRGRHRRHRVAVGPRVAGRASGGVRRLDSDGGHLGVWSSTSWPTSREPAGRRLRWPRLLGTRNSRERGANPDEPRACQLGDRPGGGDGIGLWGRALTSCVSLVAVHPVPLQRPRHVGTVGVGVSIVSHSGSLSGARPGVSGRSERAESAGARDFRTGISSERYSRAPLVIRVLRDRRRLSGPPSGGRQRVEGADGAQ
jgi:hypothetical protein